MFVTLDLKNSTIPDVNDLLPGRSYKAMLAPKIKGGISFYRADIPTLVNNGYFPDYKVCEYNGDPYGFAENLDSVSKYLIEKYKFDNRNLLIVYETISKSTASNFGYNGGQFIDHNGYMTESSLISDYVSKHPEYIFEYFSDAQQLVGYKVYQLHKF